MEIKDKTVMVLGGYGQVGSSMSKLLLTYEPKEIVITSLREEEVLAAARELSQDNKSGTRITAVSGNLFLRWDMRHMDLGAVSGDPGLLKALVDDVLGELTEDVLTSSTLYRVIVGHRPDIIVDCITTATALAYRNIYHLYDEIRGAEGPKNESPVDAHSLDRLFATMAIPPLIRHVQILNEAMRRAATGLYLKVGTTGTGGMGLNIPFTHGEESPSRLLMAKAAVAGAHSMLLFLLRQMPGKTIIKELKPAAMIGWKSIGRGMVRKGGNPVALVDCSPDQAYCLVDGGTFAVGDLPAGVLWTDRYLEGTYVDTGENGVFSLSEFKALTSLGLMEFLTPEEIAYQGLELIRGAGSSRDVLGALEGAVMGPTYRAGVLRDRVVKTMETLGKMGVAYGQLGPRVSKLVFEAQLLRDAFFTMEAFVSKEVSHAVTSLEKSVWDNASWRREALSIGIPILLPDGKRLLFAHRDCVDKEWEQKPWLITPDAVDRWASHEWIDLRPNNVGRWQERLRSMIEERNATSGDGSSRFDRGEAFWERDKAGETVIDPGEAVAWVFIHESGGGRREAYRCVEGY